MLELPKSKKYKLNPNSFLVRGAKRTMICDLERSNYQLIPNLLGEILDDETCYSISMVISKYSDKKKEHADIILEYFDFLIKHDLIFFTDYPEYYKKIELDWDRPSIIDNAIIDINNSSDYNYIPIFGQLGSLGCRNIQLRAFRVLTSLEISDILEAVNETIIESIQFIIPFLGHEDSEVLIRLAKKYPRIRFIQLYGAEDDSTIFTNEDGSTNIVTVQEHLNNHKCCGVISHLYFSVALATFSESQQNNTCLNRKISIDVNGNIKNCPSMTENYGNIKDTTLEEGLKHPDFKKYWNIKKDEISKCRDCEFRHVCTDCRAFREDPNDIYSAPLKCGYDPYTNKWEEWSENPLKQKAIEHYGLKELVTV